MRAYWTVFSARFRMLLQYRGAALAGFLTQLFFGLLRVMIFTGFYESATGAEPMTLQQVVDYVWLGQAMFMLVILRVDRDVEEMVRTGNVAYELLRPVGLYPFWFSRALALRGAPLLLRAVPMLAVALLFLDLQPPSSWSSGLLFAVSIVCALLLCAAITVLLSISLVWTISGRGIDQLVRAAAYLLSGIVVPLPLYPDWVQPIVNVLPFRGLMDVPLRIYVGQIAFDEAVWNIGSQVLWIALLVAAGWASLGGTLRRVSVQGG